MLPACMHLLPAHFNRSIQYSPVDLRLACTSAPLARYTLAKSDAHQSPLKCGSRNERRREKKVRPAAKLQYAKWRIPTTGMHHCHAVTGTVLRVWCFVSLTPYSRCMKTFKFLSSAGSGMINRPQEDATFAWRVSPDFARLRRKSNLAPWTCDP